MVVKEVKPGYLKVPLAKYQKFTEKLEKQNEENIKFVNRISKITGFKDHLK